MELEFGGRRYPVPLEELIVGSDPGAGLVVPGAEPRHAIVRPLGDRMATIRVATEGARILVNAVAVGVEPTPLLHGDVIQIGDHRITVSNPGQAAASQAPLPEGARERLHDTLFGVPRPEGLTRPPVAAPPAASPAPAARRLSPALVAVAVVVIAVLAWFLLS